MIPLSFTSIGASTAGKEMSLLLIFSTYLFLRPAPLPTPVGISRVFVARDHRCKGIGHALLNAMSQSFIHACPLDPVKGHIAFSQPTGDGRRLMESWGRGKVRVYEE